MNIIGYRIYSRMDAEQLNIILKLHVKAIFVADGFSESKET